MAFDLQRRRDARLMAREDRMFGIVLICAVLAAGIFAIHEVFHSFHTLPVIAICAFVIGYAAFYTSIFIWKRMCRRGV